MRSSPAAHVASCGRWSRMPSLATCSGVSLDGFSVRFVLVPSMSCDLSLLGLVSCCLVFRVRVLAFVAVLMVRVACLVRRAVSVVIVFRCGRQSKPVLAYACHRFVCDVVDFSSVQLHWLAKSRESLPFRVDEVAAPTQQARPVRSCVPACIGFGPAMSTVVFGRPFRFLF